MTAQTILPANSVTGGYEVANSLRFNRGSSDNLSKSFGSGNRNTFTISAWVKRSSAGASIDVHPIFSRYTAANDAGFLGLYLNVNSLNFTGYNTILLQTNRFFRDFSAWYHIVLAADTTQGTAANRLKLYVNGVQETSFATANYPDEDADLAINENVAHYVGRYKDNYMNGYMSEVCFIDGLALAPTSFGEFDEDSGIWKPIDGLADDLTFGDNGFYLEFKQSGTGTNASGMGADTSGNTNHFAVNNLTAIDQTTDTCTNNFAVINPEDVGARVNLSEGNLKFIGETSTGAEQWGRTTFGVSKGKWYWEMTKIANNPAIGIVTMQSPLNEVIENNTAARGLIYTGGQIDGQDNSGQVNALATSIADYGDNDIVSCMMDLDNGFIYFAKNGTIQIGADDSTTGNPASGSSGTGAANPTSQLLTNQHDGVWSPLIFDNSSNPAATAIYNFGNPTVAPSSGNADGNGHGNFEYAPPSGYLALCTKNLAENG